MAHSDLDSALDGCYVAFLAMVMAGMAIYATGHYTWWAVGLPTACVAGALAFYRRKLLNRVAKAQLGRAFVSLPASGRAGVPLAGLVCCRAPQPGVVVDRVRVRLLRGQQPDWETVEELHLGEGALLLEDTTTRWQIDLPLAATLSPGSYTVEVSIEVPRWPDWVHTYPLSLFPSISADPPPLPEPELRIKTTRAGQSTCPYCRDTLADLPREALLQCGDCRTVFHAECVYELGRCTTQGCSRSQARRRARG